LIIISAKKGLWSRPQTITLSVDIVAVVDAGIAHLTMKTCLNRENQH